MPSRCIHLDSGKSMQGSALRALLRWNEHGRKWMPHKNVGIMSYRWNEASAPPNW